MANKKENICFRHKNNNKHLYLRFFTYFFIFITLNLFASVCVGQSFDSVFVQHQDDSILSVLPHAHSNAIDSKVEYEAQDSIVFYVNKKKVIAYGDSKVTYETIELQSEFLELDIPSNEVFAKGLPDSTGTILGAPIYKDASDEFNADSLRYSFKSKQGLAFGIFTKQEDGYLHGGRTKIHDSKEIHIEHGKYTTCDAKHPHFHIELSKGIVVPDDKIVFGPAWLVLDEVPLPIVIPFGYFPIKKGRANGIIIPTVGEEYGKGFYFRNGGVYFGLGEYVDLKLTGDIYTLGSWRTNVSSNYVLRYKFSGNFDVGYSSLIMDEIRQSPSFSVRWTHTQDPKSMNNSNFSANVNYASVGYARQNTYDTEEFLNSSISSSIYYSKKITGTPFNFSTSFSHQQNNRDSTIYLTIPQISLSASSVAPFKRKQITTKERFYERITVSYSGSFQNKLSGAKLDSTFYTQQTLEKFQSGINHSIPISSSFTLLKHIHLSPFFNYTERWYNDKIVREWDADKPVHSAFDTTYGAVNETKIKEFSRVYNYAFGVSSQTKIYGMYQFRGTFIKAVRHIVTPSVSYTMAPDFSSARYGYYAHYYNEDKSETVKYSYFEKGIFGIPVGQRQSAISFSLNNNVEAKIKSKNDTVTGYTKVKIIESLSLSGSYNFAADSLRMSYIQLAGYTTLFKRARINYSSTFDPYALGSTMQNNRKQTVRTNSYMLDSYGTLWRKTDESLRTGINYTFGPIQENSEKEKNGMYDYWDVPWNLTVGYNISVPRKYYYNYANQLDSVSTKVQQDLSLSGKISLTKKWNVTVSTGWDFQEKAISYTTLDFYRDLHCWHMAFNWIPLGERQRWEFVIRVNADMLKDLKYEMKGQTNYF